MFLALAPLVLGLGFVPQPHAPLNPLNLNPVVSNTLVSLGFQLMGFYGITYQFGQIWCYLRDVRYSRVSGRRGSAVYCFKHSINKVTEGIL